MLVENLPSPFDRRVWQEATTLRDAGYTVSIICPTGKGYEKRSRSSTASHIYRYPLPLEAAGARATRWSTGRPAGRSRCAGGCSLTRGFDVIHACNPPDLFFLIGGFFKLFGKKFLFDHHDIGPELYEAKFGRRDFFYRLMLWLERWTFATADVSIATNESYRRIAIERGGMAPERVFVVRSGPSLERMKHPARRTRAQEGARYLVGYVGVMGKQEGIDLLLQAVRTSCSTWAHRRAFRAGGRRHVARGDEGAGRALGVADFVTFTGRVPDDEMLACSTPPTSA
jgi:glycosyltransferase involved in cell wall biosynthesis